jgi:putative glutamine amidotransferase
VLGTQYVRAVERAGAAAVLLSPAHEEAALDRVLGLLDGLVLSGGEDIDPSRYGQPPHPALGETTPERDAMEIHVLEDGVRRGLPVLAICRGIQLLNVARGGTLFQDLDAQRPGPIEHRQKATVDRMWHDVTIERGSLLAAAIGAASVEVNSFHHQGIDRLGRGLRAVAWAGDGLIEGVEDTEGRWILGVQWHPERGESAASAPLFAALARAASAHAAGTPR